LRLSNENTKHYGNVRHKNKKYTNRKKEKYSSKIVPLMVSEYLNKLPGICFDRDADPIEPNQYLKELIKQTDILINKSLN
jgi:hypothetical protein